MRYNNIKHRFTAILSAFVMILSLMCVPAFAASDTNGRDIARKGFGGGIYEPCRFCGLYREIDWYK